METAVSVIVPVYNGGKTIKRCVDSILCQTLSDIEVIVVNDGSQDNTLSVLESIEDNRIKVITQPNEGQGGARNKGMSIAGGKYIAFVDSDDTIESDMLFAMYKRAEETNADVVQCNLYDIYADGRKTVQIESADETVEIKNRGEYTDLYFTPCRHSYEVCNKLIRKSVLDKSGIIFHDTREIFSEDLLFNLELISHIKTISFIKKPYYNYYQNENSHFHGDAEKRLEGICNLFRTFTERADNEMKSAASYTAAMIIIYNIGFCTETLTAKNVFLSKEFKNYLTAALKRQCKMKHRIFIFAMRGLPLRGKKILAKKYVGRLRL